MTISHPFAGKNISRTSLILWLLLSGCAAPQCQPGAGHAMRIFNLYFGRSVAKRSEVTNSDWRDFRDRVITPALPSGYTVLDGEGAWRNPGSNVTVSEATKILVVAMPDTAESQSIINGIRSGWQHRFHQYVVGMTVQTGCGSFLPEEAPR
jgi:hypothetical protein